MIYSLLLCLSPPPPPPPPPPCCLLSFFVCLCLFFMCSHFCCLGCQFLIIGLRFCTFRVLVSLIWIYLGKTSTSCIYVYTLCTLLFVIPQFYWHFKNLHLQPFISNYLLICFCCSLPLFVKIYLLSCEFFPCMWFGSFCTEANSKNEQFTYFEIKRSGFSPSYSSWSPVCFYAYIA